MSRVNGMNKTYCAILALAAGMLSAILLPGCLSDDPTVGYTARSQYRKGIQTVAVPIWTRGKKVYRRNVEIRLTQALVKRIELDTPYKVTDKQKADTLLTGSIEQIEQATLSYNPDTGRPREIEVAFTVVFKWEDLRTGDVIVNRRNFRIADVYIPPHPFDEDFFRGSEALMERLARRVVETMEADWGEF